MKTHRHLATLALVVLLTSCAGGPKTTRQPAASSKPAGQIEDIPTEKADMLGYIKSPFAPDAGYIDVRGYPKGKEIRDPYSGKVFVLEKDYSRLAAAPGS